MTARGGIALVATVVFLSGILPSTSGLAAPPARPVGPPPSVQAPDPLAEAQRCYGQGDLACVIEKLQASELPAAQTSERWRLLAFAYARLDRHDLARQAFARWIALSPDNKLERDSTPPAVWADYAAALLERLGPELERGVHVDVRPVLPPPPVTPTDLPRFEPPPLSDRDTARNFAFSLTAGVVGPQTVGKRTGLGGLACFGIDLEPNPRMVVGWRGGLLTQPSQFERGQEIPAMLVHAGWTAARFGTEAPGDLAVDLLASGGVGWGLYAAEPLAWLGARVRGEPRQGRFGWRAALEVSVLPSPWDAGPYAVLSVGASLRPAPATK